jgi:uncharacterized protein (DUF983 family)
MTRLRIAGRAVRRGWRNRCPHCGVGPIYRGWADQLPACPACGLVYERRPGDTWLYVVAGDRVPIAVLVVLVYFDLFRSYSALRLGLLAAVGALLVTTARGRWGVGIALHYVVRRFWPDPDDPVPPAGPDGDGIPTQMSAGRVEPTSL